MSQRLWDILRIENLSSIAALSYRWTSCLYSLELNFFFLIFSLKVCGLKRSFVVEIFLELNFISDDSAIWLDIPSHTRGRSKLCVTNLIRLRYILEMKNQPIKWPVVNKLILDSLDKRVDGAVGNQDLGLKRIWRFIEILKSDWSLLIVVKTCAKTLSYSHHHSEWTCEITCAPEIIHYQPISVQCRMYVGTSLKHS